MCQYFHPTFFLFFSFPLLPPFESRELGSTEGASLRPNPFASSSKLSRPIFQPRRYSRYTRAVSSCEIASPRKKGKLDREDSKRNAKEVAGERRRSNKRTRCSSPGWEGVSGALYYKLYGHGTSLEGFNCVISEPLSRVPTINLEICLLSVEVRLVQMPLDAMQARKQRKSVYICVNLDQETTISTRKMNIVVELRDPLF